MLIACLMVLPLITCAHNTTSSVTTTPDSEIELPPPSLLHSLYQNTAEIIDTFWSDKGSDYRQIGVPGNIGIPLGTFLVALLATVFGVVGFGSVGLLAAKALSVGTLALFLTALNIFKHKSNKSDSGGQTVHLVPIPTHHDYLHDRNDVLPPYLTYVDRKL